MPGNFLNGITGKLAENWIANLLTPAFAFWLGGLAAWVWRFEWSTLVNWFVDLTDPTKISVLVLGFLIVTVSAAVIQRFDLAAIDFWKATGLAFFIRFNTYSHGVSYSNKDKRAIDYSASSARERLD